MQVLITGATGALGPAVVGAFVREGWGVRTLSLGMPDRPWVQGVDARIGDVTDPVCVRDAVAGMDVVVHMAALLHVLRPAPGYETECERVNVGGTRTVTREASAAGVGRLVFLSTIAVYGRGDGRPFTEDSPPRPETPYARTKLRAEAEVLAARGPAGEPTGCVLRLAAVYGAGVKGNYQRLVAALGARTFIPVGAGQNRRALVHESDVGAAAVCAASSRTAAGRIYNVSDPRPYTMAEIVAAICEALGRRPPRLRVPLGMARLAAGLVEDLAARVGKASPISRSTIDKYTEDVVVDAERMAGELGFRTTVSLTEGWRQALGAERQGAGGRAAK